MSEVANKPAWENRYGNIKVSIWANQGKDGVWYSVTLTRRYQDNGLWKSATSLGKNDILPASLLLQRAFEWIEGQTQHSGK
jgi:hypothetical protein